MQNKKGLFVGKYWLSHALHIICHKIAFLKLYIQNMLDNVFWKLCYWKKYMLLLLPLLIQTWMHLTSKTLLILRFLSQIMGVSMLNNIFFREISTPELRGTLTILMPAAANTGNLLMYILGSLLPWRLTTLPGAILPLLPILLVFFLPETPVWLISRWNLRIYSMKHYEVYI